MQKIEKVYLSKMGNCSNVFGNVPRFVFKTGIKAVFKDAEYWYSICRTSSDTDKIM